MQNLLNQLELFTNFLPAGSGWIVQIFIILVLTQLAKIFALKLLNKLEAKVVATKNIWDDLIIEVAKKPLAAFIWLQGLLLAVKVLDANSQLNLGASLVLTSKAVTIVLVTWLMLLLINGLTTKLASDKALKTPLDPTTAQATNKLLKAAVLITSGLVLLQVFGFSISGILAFGGVGGIAVGFAARDLLANFFGALLLYFDRPFTVGDWIRSPDREIEGTVEEIGWRITRIRTFDQRPLYVPNSIFANISVENPSRMFNRRIKESFSIRYEDADKMSDLIAAIKSYLKNHPDLETEKRTLIVNFDTYGPYSLNFFIYTFTKTTNWVDYHQIKQGVLLGIHELISQAGAQLTLPKRSLEFLNHPTSLETLKD